MYVQTKKVVIIYIVTIVTFLSILSSFYRDAQDAVRQISVVTSEELSYKISFAQSIFNDLSIESTDSEEVSLYGASIYQISQKSSAQLTNIVSGSDTIIIVGDTFNEYLADLIEANESKQFVLVENSADFNFDNVYQLNINYKQIYDSINRVSNNQKSVVVLPSEFSSLAEREYYEHEIATNGNIKLEIIEDTSDVATIEDSLRKDLSNGFTNVYSLDPYNNQTIIEVVDSYNNELVANAAESEAASEQSEANSEASEASSEASEISSEASEASSEATGEATADLHPATLKYLTLSQVEYLSQNADEGYIKYIYDVSENMKEIIQGTINGQVSQNDELISISNNK